ncbi:MAG TPA: glycosyltransferase [Limnochordales bacterium]
MLQPTRSWRRGRRRRRGRRALGGYRRRRWVGSRRRWNRGWARRASRWLGPSTRAGLDRLLQARWSAGFGRLPGMPKRSPYVYYVGPFYGPGGYNYEARAVLRQLLDAGFTVRVLPPPPPGRWWAGLEIDDQLGHWFHLLRRPVRGRRPQVSLVHATPDVFFAAAPGTIRIGRTMFETDRLSPAWVAACRTMHAIWVPSHFNYHTFAASGVDPRKLRVLPIGVDSGLFRPDTPPLPVPEARGFRFLAVFTWLQRKGWPFLVEAYVREFHPDEDVTLILKTNPGVAPILASFIAGLRLPWDGHAPIIVDQRVLPVHQMVGLYAACHAFVLPTRGEGWGLPLMEAMAAGLPVIATRWSAQTDFLNDENAYLVNVEGLEPASPHVEQAHLYSGHLWAKPSVDHLRALMRHVFTHREEARAKGMRARHDVVHRWDLRLTGPAFAHELARWVRG